VSAPTPSERVDRFLAHLTIHTLAPASAPTDPHTVASAATGERARTGSFPSAGAGHHLQGAHR
jgi:hypothetical protein